VPTRDDELPTVAALAEAIDRPSAHLLASSRAFIEICRDKLISQRAFAGIGIPTAPTWLLGERPEAWPESHPDAVMIVKPRYGSGSRSVRRLRFHRLAVEGASSDDVVQPLQRGSEVTVDAYISFNGIPIHYVCRSRLRTAGGQSIAGETVYSPELAQFTMAVLDACSGMGARGILSFQLFDDGDRIVLGEVNARVASGYPLSHAAGAAYPEWLGREVLGLPIEPMLGQYEVGLRFARGSHDIVYRQIEGEASSEWPSHLR
jgi:carbamoyl-phosphate synthase large subunit